MVFSCDWSFCGILIALNRLNAVFLKDTLSIKDEKLFKACKSVCLLEQLQGRYPHQKCENFNTLSQFSQ